MTDQNKYDLSKLITYNSDFNKNININCVISMAFFVNGLFYSIFLHLFSYTKTVYRCTFIGIYMLFIKITMLYCGTFNLIFDKNFIFIMMISIVGIFTAFFIEDKQDYNIISDKKKLEIFEQIENNLDTAD